MILKGKQAPFGSAVSSAYGGDTPWGCILTPTAPGPAFQAKSGFRL
jgi:hypothetical protein